jgi:hypothetical protein
MQARRPSLPALCLAPRAFIAALSTTALLGAGLLVAANAHAEDVKVELVAKGGKAAGEVKVVRLKRDDQVALSIVSDRADEVHVHGYDLKLNLEPNKPAVLQFAAKRTGRFAIELHKSGAELGVLEIYPK